jgi:hypothetical protein
MGVKDNYPKKKQKTKGTPIPQNNNLLAISSTKTNMLLKEIRNIYLSRLPNLPKSSHDCSLYESKSV